MQQAMQVNYMTQYQHVQQTYDIQNSKRQLKYVIEKFRTLHTGDSKSIAMLNEADQYLTNEDVYSCANKIQCIINDHQNNSEMNQTHSTVIEEAKTTAQQFPEMMAFPSFMPVQMMMPAPQIPKA